MLIEIDDLTRTYGAVTALSGVSLAVADRGIVGLLGQNGAGKTTLVEILEGLRAPSGGNVRVLGLDPQEDGPRLREKLGVQLQSSPLPQALTPVETLRMLGGFFATARDPDEIIDRVGLRSRSHAPNRTLSGGEKQRLAIGMALINDPQIVILDEPTAGLDPVARRDLHALLADLRAADRLILLTTHYIEEAEHLCDRVVILNAGEIVADGAPGDLSRNAGHGVTVEIAAPEGFDDRALIDSGASPSGSRGPYLRYSAPDAPAALRVVADIIERNPGALHDVRVSAPSLEESYLRLVGGAGSEAGR